MLQIVLHLPEELKSLAWALQAVAKTATELLDSLSSGSVPDYAIVETQVAQQAQAVERGLHQDLLQALDVDAPFVPTLKGPHAIQASIPKGLKRIDPARASNS